MKFCSYKYVAGPKRGTNCQTFLRGKDSEFCYKHKKFRKEDVPESKPVEEAKVEVTTVIEKSPPIPIVEPKKPEIAESSQPTSIKKSTVIQLPLDLESDSSDFSCSSSESDSSDFSISD